MGYEFALKLATECGDTNTVEALRRNGPPPYAAGDMASKTLAYGNILDGYMGEHAAGGINLLDVLQAPEYGLLDKANWFRGFVDTCTVVYPQLKHLDFTTQAARLDVPVYFLAGRGDVNEIASLVEQYYNVLQAPHKELIWFDKSGLTPIEYESNTVVDVMVNRVLAQTYH